MKKSILISLFCLQILTLAGVGATAYFTFMNKARIRATQRVLVDTQESLSSTVAFMDKIAKAEQEQEAAQRPLASGTAAPNFSLADENGQTVSLQDLQGQKTLLVFSQESCPYCKNFYPVLNEFQATQDDVRVVIMQLDSTPEQNKAYKEQEGIHATMLAATANELQQYKVMQTPTSVLLDEEGTVLGVQAVSQLAELQGFVQSACANCEVSATAQQG